MGQVFINNEEVNILEANIATCVCVCLYSKKLRIGGITHIDRSYENDSTPSERLLRENSFHYAHQAIPHLVELIKQGKRSMKTSDLRLVIAGGKNENDTTISEVLSELGLGILYNKSKKPILRTLPESKYKFKLNGYDILQGTNRLLSFYFHEKPYIRIKRSKRFKEEGLWKTHILQPIKILL